jgi:hypothetical protein
MAPREFRIGLDDNQYSDSEYRINPSDKSRDSHMEDRDLQENQETRNKKASTGKARIRSNLEPDTTARASTIVHQISSAELNPGASKHATSTSQREPRVTQKSAAARQSQASSSKKNSVAGKNPQRSMQTTDNRDDGENRLKIKQESFQDLQSSSGLPKRKRGVKDIDANKTEVIESYGQGMK